MEHNRWEREGEQKRNRLRGRGPEVVSLEKRSGVKP